MGFAYGYDMSVETWKEIPGFPDYEMSTYGRHRRVRAAKSNNSKPRLLKSDVNQKYAKCALYHEGKYKTHLVHRLVLLTFVGPPPTPAHEGAHGNGKRHNNRLDNLRWATRRENAADRILHGTVPRGCSHPSTTLTERQVKAIRKLNARGIGAFLISSAVGISNLSVERIVRGKSFK